MPPPASSAASCEAASMPRARPETTVTPAMASCPARWRAALSPYAEARREPTMATAGFFSSAVSLR